MVLLTCSTMTWINNFAQYLIHTSVQKWWSKDASLPHSRIHRKETGHGPLPYFTAFSVPEYRPISRPGIQRRCRRSQSALRCTQSNAFLRLTWAISIPCWNSRWRSTSMQCARTQTVVDPIGNWSVLWHFSKWLRIDISSRTSTLPSTLSSVILL